MDSYTHQKIQYPNRKKLVVIIVSIIVFLLIACGSAFVLYQINRQRLIDGIKAELSKVPSIMESSRTTSGAYPSSIPASLLSGTTKVDLAGQGSYDGMSYCVTGISKSDKSIVYHIDSTSNTPTVKGCADAANLPTPVVPAGLLLGSVGPDQVNVAWETSLYARSYVVECSPNADFSAPVIDKSVKDTTGVCSGLKSSTLYYVHVKSGNSSKGSKWSVAITAKTSEMSVAPTNFSGTGLSSSSIGYSWSAIDGAKSYVVEIASDVNFMKNVHAQTVPPSKLSVIFTGLQSGTAYFAHVKAVTADFNAAAAAFSNEIQVRTLAS